MNASLISVNAAVNEAAANTVTSPDTPEGAVVSGTAVAATVVAGASVVGAGVTETVVGAAVSATLVAAVSMLDCAPSSSSPQAEMRASSATAQSDARCLLCIPGTLVSELLCGSCWTLDQPQEEDDVKLSARNQLKATVTDVKLGEVMSTVVVSLPDGQVITSAITKASVEDLELSPGDDVLVIIKSTEVMIAKPD